MNNHISNNVSVQLGNNTAWFVAQRIADAYNAGDQDGAKADWQQSQVRLTAEEKIEFGKRVQLLIQQGSK